MLVILVCLLSANCFIRTVSSSAEVSSSSQASVVANCGNSEKVDLPSKGLPSKAPTGDKNATITCGPNEQLDECPSYCPSDYCPTGDGQNEKCPKPNPCPPPACKCIFNYRRAQNGTCIPARECPPFECNKPHEVYDACPPACPSDSCSQATPTGKCPLPGKIGIIVACKPACRCEKGYWRNNGTCVPYDQCPGKLTCGANEVVENCPSTCNTDKCPTSNNEPQSCTKPCDCPPPACKCRLNYRRAANGTCIPTGQCPPFPCDGPNEEYDPCPPLCPTDDCSQSTVNGTCPLIGRIGILLICNPKCRCKKNYWRYNGVCIPYEQCPKNIKCAPGEVVDTCPAICNTDYCPTNENDIRSCYVPKPCLKPACRCPFNYLRAQNGTCIPAEQCPPIKCRRPHEVYQSCPPICPSDDCRQANLNGKCPIPEYKDVKFECYPGCRCEKSYFRQNGTCVPLGQCDATECLRENEILDCVKTCPPERNCQNRGALYKCTSESQKHCQVKCVCSSDFYRNSTEDCVPIELCDSLDCSGPNEFYACGGACDNVCADLSFQSQEKCRIINVRCNDKCYCKKGYARDAKGICIPIDKCPPSCPKNEEYTSNKPICPSDKCSSILARCAPKLSGKPGCVCKPGFLRKEEGAPCEPLCKCSESAQDCRSE